MYDVFISYSHIDGKYADAVCHHLEEANIKCWYAPRNIPIGSAWAESINTAIRQSRIFLVIISKNSVISNQVFKEINLAKEKGLKIITFKISRVAIPDPIDSILESGHWLDCINRSLYSSLDKLHRQVCENLDISYTKVKRQNKIIKLVVKYLANISKSFIALLSKLKSVFRRLFENLKSSVFTVLLIVVIAIIIYLILSGLASTIYIRLRYGIWA